MASGTLFSTDSLAPSHKDRPHLRQRTHGRQTNCSEFMTGKSGSEEDEEDGGVSFSMEIVAAGACRKGVRGVSRRRFYQPGSKAKIAER